ncbi:MAG: hypothetical protein ACHQT8_06015 [Chlamydiales bacterium]
MLYEKVKELSNILLATQRALLGVVTSALRAVVVDLDNDKQVAYIHFYYHGTVPEEIIDLWDCAITEVIAAMGGDYVLDEGIERIDFPNKIPFRGRFAYRRHEDLVDEKQL